jgi:branched-chain amino acid transport system substrate-binding protein
MSEAIAFALSKANWTAGPYTLAYQSCDDSTASAGKWDPATCTANATAYSSDATLVGVIGTLNSGCAQLELPIENRAPGGPLAMVSPANTDVGLTHGGPGTSAGEPDRYYPTGKRSYARTIAADDVQAAADAMLFKALHLSKVFVIEDRQAYGEGVAASMEYAARKLGLTVVGNVGWSPQAKSYVPIARTVAASGAQGVFLAGLVSENGGRLIADLRAHAPSATIVAPAGFTPVAADMTSSGGAANGIYVSVPGLPIERLPPAGSAFVSAFSKSLGGVAVDPYSIYAAQATDVLLRAIAKSDGTRSGVAAHVLGVRIAGGLLGPLAFDGNGDPTSAPVSIYRLGSGNPVLAQVVSPPSSLLPAR